VYKNFFSKTALKLFVFFGIIFLLFFFEASLVKSQGYKPLAIIAVINKDSIPMISEQILLKKFGDELNKNFDFRIQPKFELALHKVKYLTPNYTCEYLNCIMKAYTGFKHTILFLVKSEMEQNRVSLIMISKDHNWFIKHEACEICGMTLEDKIKNLVLRLGNFSLDSVGYDDKSSKIFPTSDYSSTKETTEIFKENREPSKILLKNDFQKNIKSKLTREESPLDKLQFKISQRQYNQLIWKKIKKELMFFRRTNRDFSIKKLKARLRLQIDKFGRVIAKNLVDKSGSEKFDKTILDSVDLLKLPPPMKNLILNPPYVVTILIQP